MRFPKKSGALTYLHLLNLASEFRETQVSELDQHFLQHSQAYDDEEDSEIAELIEQHVSHMQKKTHQFSRMVLTFHGNFCCYGHVFLQI